MARKYEIDVDVGKLLAEVGPRLFASPTVVLDELVQNAQRAQAKALVVRVLDVYAPGVGVIEVADDGVGLSSPTALLRLAQSGWDAGTVENEEPFGLGFWSTTVVSGRVEVRSRKWSIVIDVDRLRLTRSVQDVVHVREEDEDLRGFRVRLFAPLARREWEGRYGQNAPENVSQLTRERIEAWNDLVFRCKEHVRQLVAYMPFDSVTYRECTYWSPIESYDQASSVFEAESYGWDETEMVTNSAETWVPEGVQYARVVDTVKFRGVLWPQSDSWSAAGKAPHRGLRMLYQRRDVKLRDGVVGGALFVADGAATPRAPDRKDWVSDRKLETLYDMVKAETRAMWLDMLAQASLEDVKKFDRGLCLALEDEDLLSVPIEELVAAAEPEPKGEVNEKLVETLNDLAESDRKQRASSVRELPPVEDGPDVQGVKQNEGDPGELPMAARKARRQRVVDLKGPVFWVRERDVAANVPRLEMLKEMNVSVLTATTEAQVRALKALAERGVVVKNVADLEMDVEAELKAQSGTSLPEFVTSAAAWLASLLELDRVVFGELKLVRTMKVGEGEQQVVGTANAGAVDAVYVRGTVYVEQRYVRPMLAEAWKARDPELYMALRLVQVLAHEAAHEVGGHGERFRERMESNVEMLLVACARRAAGV